MSVWDVCMRWPWLVFGVGLLALGVLCTICFHVAVMVRGWPKSKDLTADEYREEDRND